MPACTCRGLEICHFLGDPELLAALQVPERLHHSVVAGQSTPKSACLRLSVAAGWLADEASGPED